MSNTYTNLVNKARAARAAFSAGHRSIADLEGLADELWRAYLDERSPAGSNHLKVEFDLVEELLP